MVKDGIEADTLKQIRIDNGFTDSDYWVGASQTTTGANLFSYNSGITFNDELWSSGEPSNYLSSSTQCVEMGTAADNYEFGDDNCGERQDYICETALQPICEDTWVRNHMTCIKFVEDSDSSWNNARQACQALGGDLALVKYAAEAQRIEAIRTNLGKTDEAYWVGAIQDRKRSANYRYTDFTSIPRILWFPGQPDDFTSRKRMCVTLGGKDHDLKMADTPCPTKLNYICERDN